MCIRDSLYAIRPDGTLKWRFETGNEIWSSPAIGQDGTIYVGSDGLYAISPDGTLKWRFQTSGLIKSSPAIVQDGTIYVGSDDGNLYAIASDSKGLANSPWPKFRATTTNRANVLENISLTQKPANFWPTTVSYTHLTLPTKRIV